MAGDRTRLITDPPASALRAVKRHYEWEDVWKYVVVRPPVKTVGLSLKTFGNKKGLEIHPGIRRLMAITGHTKPTVIEAIAEMRWLGFLWRISRARGSNSGLADDYQLSLPKSLEHLAMVDARTADEPSFYDLPLIAQQTAIRLKVDKRLKKVSGCLSQPGGQSGQPLVVASANLEWWSQLTPPTHTTHTSTHSMNHHSDSSESGPRASSRAARESLDDYDFIDEAVGGLDPVESSTADGMLANGMDPRAIINTIRKMREAA